MAGPPGMRGGHTAAAPPGAIPGLLARQIQPPSHRQARLPGSLARTHADVAVSLPAQWAVILPGHACRVPALLRNPGVAGDPRIDRPPPLHPGGTQRRASGEQDAARPGGPWPPGDPSTAGPPARGRDRGARPWARCSCARCRASARCSSPSAADADPCAPRLGVRRFRQSVRRARRAPGPERVAVTKQI